MCSLGDRCNECRSWSKDFMLGYVKHQRTLVSKGRKPVTSSSPSPPVTAITTAPVVSRLSLPVFEDQFREYVHAMLQNMLSQSGSVINPISTAPPAVPDSAPLLVRFLFLLLALLLLLSDSAPLLPSSPSSLFSVYFCSGSFSLLSLLFLFFGFCPSSSWFPSSSSFYLGPSLLFAPWPFCFFFLSFSSLFLLDSFRDSSYLSYSRLFFFSFLLLFLFLFGFCCVSGFGFGFVS